MANAFVCAIASVILIVSPLSTNNKGLANHNPNHTQDSQACSQSSKTTLNSEDSNCPSNQTTNSNGKPTNDGPDYLLWGTVINGVLALGTIFIAIFAVVQGLASKHSAKALVASERAWIMVDLKWSDALKVMDSRTGDGSWKTSVTFSLVCRNLGKTPAWISEIQPKLLILGSVDTTESLPENPDLTLTDERIVTAQYVGAGEHEEWKSVFMTTDGHRTVEILILYGVVRYRHLLSNKGAQTTFAYKVTPGNNLVRLSEHPKYNENT